MNTPCSLIQLKCPLCQVTVENYFSLGQHVSLTHGNESNASSGNVPSSNINKLPTGEVNKAGPSGVNKEEMDQNFEIDSDQQMLSSFLCTTNAEPGQSSNTTNKKVRKKHRRRRANAYKNVPFNANSLGSKRFLAVAKFKCPSCPRRFLRKIFFEEHLATHKEELNENCLSEKVNDAIPSTSIEDNITTVDHGSACTSNEVNDKMQSARVQKTRRKYKRRRVNCYKNVPFNGSSAWSSRKSKGVSKKLKGNSLNSKIKEKLEDLPSNEINNSTMVECEKEITDELQPIAIEFYESGFATTPHRTPEYDNSPDTTVPSISSKSTFPEFDRPVEIPRPFNVSSSLLLNIRHLFLY